MIIERNTFQLKFGKAKESIAIWKEMLEIMKNQGNHPEIRLMTDLSGKAYTLTLEMRLKSFMDIGPKTYSWMTNEATQALYQKFIPLCDSAHREYCRVEMEI